MARMRSLKPEYWEDEELASSTCRDARLLYPALWNLADEHGRLRGDPRYIKGKVFAYDDDLDAGDIDQLLGQLARGGWVQRYRVGGARYLFLPKLAKHQRLEPDKTPSRLPGPDDADPDPPPDSENFPEQSGKSPDSSAQNRTLDGRLSNGASDQGKHARANKSENFPDKSALARARLLSMEQVAGSREHVVPPSAGALALVRDEPDSTQALLGEWLEHCRKRPPGSVIGQVGKQVKAMLAEGVDLGDVRTGLAAWHHKGLHPSALPGVVNELMNASPARASPRIATSDQRMAMAPDAVAQAKALMAGGAA